MILQCIGILVRVALLNILCLCASEGFHAHGWFKAADVLVNVDKSHTWYYVICMRFVLPQHMWCWMSRWDSYGLWWSPSSLVLLFPGISSGNPLMIFQRIISHFLVSCRLYATIKSGHPMASSGEHTISLAKRLSIACYLPLFAGQSPLVPVISCSIPRTITCYTYIYNIYILCWSCLIIWWIANEASCAVIQSTVFHGELPPNAAPWRPPGAEASGRGPCSPIIFWLVVYC